MRSEEVHILSKILFCFFRLLGEKDKNFLESLVVCLFNENLAIL